MDEIAKQVTAAAARGDRLAFAAAAERLGSLDEAHTLVRSHGVLSMVERVASPSVASLVPTLRLVETRDAEGEPAPANPTMFGHFAVFNEWTEVDSFFEGHFLERIAPGAFKKTFRENRGEIKSLFQHGHDPVVGDKPLGPVDDLREDETGGYYEVPLLDASYVRDDILPGLEAGVYGASFRFQPMREEFVDEPDPSEDNPKGLPERTLKEARLFEFGPVTFPAYLSATAGVRSAVTPSVEGAETEDHPDLVGAGASSHPDPARRAVPARNYLRTGKESPSWQL